jgi:hypothetical protein
MNTLIVETLKDLKITTRYMKYDGDENEYIIFTTTDSKDTFFCDDDNQAEIYTISLNFWYKDGRSFNKAKEIKKAMKNAGFIFINSADLMDGEYYGKNMMFKYLDI